MDVYVKSTCTVDVLSSARKINVAKFHNKTATVMVVTDVAVRKSMLTMYIHLPSHSLLSPSLPPSLSLLPSLPFSLPPSLSLPPSRLEA